MKFETYKARNFEKFEDNLRSLFEKSNIISKISKNLTLIVNEGKNFTYGDPFMNKNKEKKK